MFRYHIVTTCNLAGRHCGYAADPFLNVWTARTESLRVHSNVEGATEVGKHAATHQHQCRPEITLLASLTRNAQAASERHVDVQPANRPPLRPWYAQAQGTMAEHQLAAGSTMSVAKDAAVQRSLRVTYQPFNAASTTGLAASTYHHWSEQTGFDESAHTHKLVMRRSSRCATRQNSSSETPQLP